MPYGMWLKKLSPIRHYDAVSGWRMHDEQIVPFQ